MEHRYTHRDTTGMRWRFIGTRPRSELADRVMAECHMDVDDEFGEHLSKALSRIEGEDLPKARETFKTWRAEPDATNFDSHLYRLIGKADMCNRDRLRVAYPAHVRLFEEWEKGPFIERIPANKNYPPDAIQCDGCGGYGCPGCEGKGWLPAGHPKGRRCERAGCGRPIPPDQLAIYCSNECAQADA